VRGYGLEQEPPHPTPAASTSPQRGEVKDFAALAAAFKASGAALACLCSSDKVYAALAITAAKALQAAGAKHIYLAGRAGEQEAALRAAGVNEFVFAGADALTILHQAYRLME
jgi:methylmalonyl-CoA mutase